MKDAKLVSQMNELLDYYAICEINEEYKGKQELDNKKETIKKYAAYNMKINQFKNKDGVLRYDWDYLTHKDEQAKLIGYIADLFLAHNDIDKKKAENNILMNIEKNIIDFHEEMFDDKIDEIKSHYYSYGHRDYFYEE